MPALQPRVVLQQRPLMGSQAQLLSQPQVLMQQQQCLQQRPLQSQQQRPQQQQQQQCQRMQQCLVQDHHHPNQRCPLQGRRLSQRFLLLRVRGEMAPLLWRGATAREAGR